jgi:catalase
MNVPAAMPRAMKTPPQSEVSISPSLSLMALPGDGGVRTRKVAILVADGVVGASVLAVQAALVAAGAVPKVIAPRLGAVQTTDRIELQADGSLENSPSVLFDGVALADGEASVAELSTLGQATEFLVNQHRHGKTLLAIGKAAVLLPLVGIGTVLPTGVRDPGVISDIAEPARAIAQFLAALGQHRHTERNNDPPAL